MVEYEINSNERRNFFSSLPHCYVHYIDPALLCLDLKHGHEGLRLGEKQGNIVSVCSP